MDKKYTAEDKMTHLILMCRFYDGADKDVYSEELAAHEKDKSQFLPPECMKEEFDLSSEEVERLKNASTIRFYEQCWVQERLNGYDDKGRIQEYIAYGNENFEANDGTPISLKALLWNRYYHWGGWILDQESFRKWYRTFYGSEKSNREKRAERRRSVLIAKCRYYHGEPDNPWDFNLSQSINYWRKRYWDLEKQWVEELSMSFKYAKHGWLKYWNVTEYFKEKGELLSLINHILGYHNHVLENSNSELDHDSAIESYNGMYVKYTPLAKGVEQYFSYYMGEPENPWNNDRTNLYGMFWDWEKMVAERCKDEGGGWLMKMAEATIPHTNVDWFDDEKIPLAFKVLCLYVDAMAGKWLPYEDLNEINTTYLQGIH